MAEKIVLCNESDLVSVADAIREKAGLEDNFAFPFGFAEAIAGISGGDDTYRIAKGTFNLTDNSTSYNLFTAEDLKEISGGRVQYFLMIDGFSDDVSGNLNKFAYAATTGYIDLIDSVVCTSNNPSYYMTRNHSGTLYDTVSTNPFTASRDTGITLNAKSSNPFGTQTYKWIMVMRDD